tara:strand:- start:698 stop:802 length:105 start_codon:yes stop_codon:yes gene_type:complete
MVQNSAVMGVVISLDTPTALDANIRPELLAAERF